jgi:hypothetical protein
MTIPASLKIFSFIYESRHFVLIPLYAIWIIGGIYLLFKLKKVFFLWLLIFPLVLAPLHIAFVYSGWHYRMELRDRFARTPAGDININRMPSVIRHEYAKHDHHPRFRDIKAQVAAALLLFPLLYLAGGGFFVLFTFLRNSRTQEESPKT